MSVEVPPPQKNGIYSNPQHNPNQPYSIHIAISPHTLPHLSTLVVSIESKPELIQVDVLH